MRKTIWIPIICPQNGNSFSLIKYQTLTGQHLVPMQLQKPDHFCPRTMLTRQLEAIDDGPDQTPTPVEI